MKNFTEMKHVYRVLLTQFTDNRKFVSNESFDDYQAAWNYAQNHSKEFSACGFCVIECDEPELVGTINFDEVANENNCLTTLEKENF